MPVTPGLKYFAPGVNCVSAAARYPVIPCTKVRWIVWQLAATLHGKAPQTIRRHLLAQPRIMAVGLLDQRNWLCGPTPCELPNYRAMPASLEIPGSMRSTGIDENPSLRKFFGAGWARKKTSPASNRMPWAAQSWCSCRASSPGGPLSQNDEPPVEGLTVHSGRG